MPLVANGYPTIQIVLSDLWNLFVASLDHISPASVQNGLSHSVGNVPVCDLFDGARLANNHGPVSLCHSGFSTLWTKNFVDWASPIIYAMGSHFQYKDAA
jgi:hypothetical protein